MLEIYNKLLKKYGRQNWWPCISKNKKFETCLGAILTQNTSWKNAEKAIKTLNENNLINLNKLDKISEKELSLLIKSSGYYRQKAKKIKEFINFLKSNKKITRENLLGIWGIGEETADTMLLYAYNKPYFVVDNYTKKLFSKLGYCRGDIKYNELQKLIIKNIPKDVDLYKEFHALIVEYGKG